MAIAGDLDPERRVYDAPSGSVAHLRRGCGALKPAGEVREREAGVLHGGTPICSACTGDYIPGDNGGLSEAQRRHRLLASADPAELDI